MRWLALLFPLSSLFAEVSALYLCWYEDPTTTMTIQWHSPQQTPEEDCFLFKEDGSWEALKGEKKNLEHLFVYSLPLKNLKPDTTYFFKVGSDPRSYQFRTLANNLENSLRFVVGGDVYASAKRFRKMAKAVMEYQPHFAILGGDIAYSSQLSLLRSSPLRKWLSFLNDWKKTTTTKEGKMLPFFIVPGDKDIAPDRYESFFTLFAFPEKKLYRKIDIGPLISFFLLDTHHFHPIEGEQTLWLEKTLSQNIEAPYRFAIYRKAAYPSFDSGSEDLSLKIKTHWIPLFEKYGLLAAIENEHRSFKRTFPIKANQIDTTGITYLSDGGWSSSPFQTNDFWYLAKKTKKNSVLCIELSQEKADIRAISLNNTLIDKINLYPKN